MQVPDSLRATLVDLRRSIHREPELAFKEERTAAKLEQALRSVGVTDVQRVAGTAVIGRIAGTDRKAPAVAIRGDMDALPIQEETGLEFSSMSKGVMHACGHDVHATWAVGAAAMLVDKPARGDSIIVLQPAEEIGKGAAAVLESGTLKDAAAIFGAHVDRRFELGQVVSDPGPLAAGSDEFEIEVIGQGAHAARPHEARDPIVAAAAIVTAIQTIVARKLNPATPGVITVGKISAGTAPNIIPDRATLSGTIRSVDAASRAVMIEELKRVAVGVAEAHTVTARINMPAGTPPLLNDSRVTAWGREAVSRVLGEQALVPLGFLNLAAEDFAFYLERMPGCFLRIGAREPGGAVIPAHSPRFYPAEESIFIGASVLAECARVTSDKLAS